MLTQRLSTISCLWFNWNPRYIGRTAKCVWRKNTINREILYCPFYLPCDIVCEDGDLIFLFPGRKFNVVLRLSRAFCFSAVLFFFSFLVFSAFFMLMLWFNCLLFVSLNYTEFILPKVGVSCIACFANCFTKCFANENVWKLVR